MRVRLCDCTPAQHRQGYICTKDKHTGLYRRMGMREFFTAFASKTAHMMGSYWAFLLAALIVVIWGATGPLFHYSDTWQLVINTGTTVVTFLMVFLIQNTQNRDNLAIQLKLDELIKGVKGARNRLVSLESYSDEELERLRAEFRELHERAC